MKKYHNFICRLIDVTAGPFSIFVFSFSVICYLSLGLAGMSPEGHLIFTIEMIKISMLEIVFNISAAMVFSSLLYFALSYLCLSIFAQSLDMDELEYVNKQMEIVFEEMKSNSYCADTVVSNMNNMEKFAHNIFSFFATFFDLLVVPFILTGMVLMRFSTSLKYEGLVFVVVPSLIDIILHLSRMKIERDVSVKCFEKDGIEDYG